MKPVGLQNQRDYFREKISLGKTEREVFIETKEKGLLLAAKNMDNLLELCRKYGIKMNVAIIPDIDQTLDGNIDSAFAIFWRDFCKKRDIEFITHYPDFIYSSNPSTAVDKYFLPHDPHLSGAGHLLVAKSWLQRYAAKYKKLQYP